MPVTNTAVLGTSAKLTDRIDAYDWQQVTEDLHNRGNSVLQQLLTAVECEELIGLYEEPDRFRSRIVMQRYNFGQGEYRYFAYPLPRLISELRSCLYAKLVSVTNHWHEAMRLESRFPATHDKFIQRCHMAGQKRPTPLLLCYEEGDYNCLHQDLYGEQVFPLQVTVLLSRPEKDFTGGELILTEQRPRMQSRAEVVPLQQGDAVVFAVNRRPVQGKRGYYRVNMRHGVSRLRSGHRMTLGVIFHDAE